MNVAQSFFKMGQDIGMHVMPFINLKNNDWNATAHEIPPIGTGTQEGFASCKKQCGLKY
jgi:hypothetical protein